MTPGKKIILIWLGLVTMYIVSFVLPHWHVTAASFASYSLQTLLFLISIYLVRHEQMRKTKFVFLNFAIFFGMSFLFHLYSFVGTVFFQHEPMARHFFFQYVSLGLYFFLLAFTLCYLTIDLLFRDFGVVAKYVIAAAIVGGFFMYYYGPLLSNPKYLYSTKEIAEFRELDKIATLKATESGVQASVQDLLSALPHTDAPLLNKLSPEERSTRVDELHPYLSGTNYIILLFKPIYLNVIQMCTLCLGLILLFFGYQYKKDPPQGAYIEKIMFAFLIYCTLEMFHAWSFIKTIEWQSLADIVSVGQFLSAVVLVGTSIIFGLRLRFITSAKGEFYEHEIAESPWAVTRWRDALDNLVVSHFFDRRELLGRLFANPLAKKSAHTNSQ
ncbi:MAG: hypothetical protein HY961_05280 [Ignavibacteriae bacterium]|nr:hypothetical protein [Ignavibacteriota bacterium]